MRTMPYIPIQCQAVRALAQLIFEEDFSSVLICFACFQLKNTSKFQCYEERACYFVEDTIWLIFFLIFLFSFFFFG